MAGSIPEFSIRAESMAVPVAPAGYWRVVWQRFKRHRIAYIGAFLFALLLILVTVGPHMVPYELDQISLSERMNLPSAKHWLGTHELGREPWEGTMDGGGGRPVD